MAAPRKRKREPPFDVTGIDFSVITTALKTGGKLIEQIINGIHYGSPEVRLLMLEECDFIIECRVCRGLFRALPNFIAHKRIYCCQAFCDVNPNLPFQATMTFGSVREEPVVVVPTAPHESDLDSGLGVHQDEKKNRDIGDSSKPAADSNILKANSDLAPCQTQTGAGTSRGDLAPCQTQTGAGTSRGDLAPCQTQTGAGTSRGDLAPCQTQIGAGTSRGDLAPCQTQAGAGTSKGEEDEVLGNKTLSKVRSQHSEQKTTAQLESTMRQIEEGKLGQSKQFALCTAAVQKMEREKGLEERSAPLHLIPIPSNPCAVFVHSGDMTEKLAVSQSPSSVCSPAAPPACSSLPGSHHSQNKDSIKISQKSAVIQKSAAQSSKLSEGTTPPTAEAAAALAARKTAVARSTLRNVTRVVRELRQKKEEAAMRAQTKAKAEVKKEVGPKIVWPIKKTDSDPLPALPVTVLRPYTPFANNATMHTSRPQEEGVLRFQKAWSPVPKGDDYLSQQTLEKGGSLRAVVKRCLTGRPWALRTSPLKNDHGERGASVESSSDAGSVSDKGEALSSGQVHWQDNGIGQAAMDFDNMRCKICNVEFLRRKSLMYHCQTRHSGQRTIYPCPYCQRVFYYFWGLTRHLNTNHKKSPSDIDRMRKSLRRKAYKQDIVEDALTSSKQKLPVSEEKDKCTVSRKSRPSVAAKKVVAISKSVPCSLSPEPIKLTLSLPLPLGHRRRVEVITNPKKTVDVYRKVYLNKRTSTLPSGLQDGGDLSLPEKMNQPKTDRSVSNLLASPNKDTGYRTRKLVAKALHTTRSKCVNKSSEVVATSQSSCHLPHTDLSSNNSKPAQNTQCLLISDVNSHSSSTVPPPEERKSEQIELLGLKAENRSLPQSAGDQKTLLQDKMRADKSFLHQAQKHNEIVHGIISPGITGDMLAKDQEMSSLSGLNGGDTSKTDLQKVLPRERNQIESESKVLASDANLTIAVAVLPRTPISVSTNNEANSGQSAALTATVADDNQTVPKTHADTLAAPALIIPTKICAVTQAAHLTCNKPSKMAPAISLIAEENNVNQMTLLSSKKLSASTSVLAVTSRVAISQASSATGGKNPSQEDVSSQGLGRKDPSLPKLVQTRSSTELSLQTTPTGPLHICPHCQRAFGRKISLTSHIKICNRSKPLGSELAQSKSRRKTESLQQSVKGRLSTGRNSKKSDSRNDFLSRDHSVLSARVSTRSLAEISDLKPLPQQKPAIQYQIGAKESTDKMENNDNSTALGQTLLQNEYSSNQESSLERQSRALKKTGSVTSSSRDSSVDSIRTRSSDSKTSQLPTLRSSCKSSRSKSRSGHDSSEHIKTKSFSVQDSSPVNPESSSSRDSAPRGKTKAQNADDDNLLTISRQRLLEQLRVAAFSRDKESRADSSKVQLLSKEVKGRTSSSDSPVKKAADRLVTQRSVTTTVLRKNPKDKSSDIQRDLLPELLSVTCAKSKLILKSTDQTSQVQFQSVGEQKLCSEAEISKPDVLPGGFLTCEVEAVAREEISSKSAVTKQKAEMVTSRQQEVDIASQRPKRKRVHKKDAESADVSESESIDSTKKHRLHSNLETDDLSNDSTSRADPQIPCSKPTMEPVTVETAYSKDKEVKDEDDQSVVLVEEIWMEKKPGKPTERVKSNRIYVVEPARSGRLTCLDTRKIGQIVDETGLICFQCGQHFTSVSNLRRHAIRHLGWRRFKCRLCRFCSYNRSECNTHIMRTHPERLRLAGSNSARIDTFITDLNRQAASMRSLKKQQTLHSRGREDVAPEGVAGSSARSSRRRGKAAAAAEGSRNQDAGFLSTDAATPSTSQDHSANRKKTPAVPALAVPAPADDAMKNKRTSCTTFNISTRNSPRKFDIRPYPRIDAVSTLNTRKGSYVKPDLMHSSSSLKAAASRNPKRAAASSSKEKAAASKLSSELSEGLASRALSQQKAVTIEKVSSLDIMVGSGVSSELTLGTTNTVNLLGGQDTLQGKGNQKVDGEKECNIASQSTDQEGSQREITVVRQLDDGDLMKVGMEEMLVLPEQFMSDDIPSPGPSQTCDRSHDGEAVEQFIN